MLPLPMTYGVAVIPGCSLGTGDLSTPFLLRQERGLILKSPERLYLHHAPGIRGGGEAL
jgi:hypothetical protein